MINDEYTKDGFTFKRRQPHGDDYLIAQYRTMDRLPHYCAVQKIRSLLVSQYHDFQSRDLNFLNDTPSISDLFLFGEFDPTDAVAKLPDLKILQAGSNHFDLSRTVSLEILIVDWHRFYEKHPFPKSLKVLGLSHYKPADLLPINYLQRLEKLHICHASLENLAGLKKLADLKELEIIYGRKLYDLSDLTTATRLESLSLKFCSKLTDYTPLAQLKNLRILGLKQCSAVPDLEFIQTLPRLESLYFVNTLIASKDLTPLTNHPKLDRAFFDNKRVYNFKDHQIQKILDDRKASTIK